MTDYSSLFREIQTSAWKCKTTDIVGYEQGQI